MCKPLATRVFILSSPRRGPPQQLSNFAMRDPLLNRQCSCVHLGGADTYESRILFASIFCVLYFVFNNGLCRWVRIQINSAFFSGMCVVSRCWKYIKESVTAGFKESLVCIKCFSVSGSFLLCAVVM